MTPSRRQFLRSAAAAGAAAALFPWLDRARADEVPARKLLIIYTPHGTVWPKWRPTGTETSFTLSPILQPLAAHVSRMQILDGISLPYGTAYYIPHTYTMPSLWTGSPIDTADNAFCRMDHGQCFGWGTGVSVDQAIAQRLPVASTLYPSIELGTFCSGLHPATRMIYSAPRTPKSPLDGPREAWQALFGNYMPDQTARARAKQLARRKSVLDAAVADLDSRKAKLSAADKARLDAHATSVRELERRLETMLPECTVPGFPADVNSQTAMDRQSDLMAAALGCGLTRIGSIQMRIADNDTSLYPWLGLTTGGHHMLSHDSSAPAQDQLALVYAWYSARIAYLLDRLAATPDPVGGSVLDNTLVIWGSELGRAWDHDVANVPFIVAGGPSIVRGGRYRVLPAGTTNHRLLVTAHHAMGFTNVAQYGALDAGSGPVPGLLA